MVEISDRLECLFSDSIEQDGGSYRIEVPKREIDNGSIISGETYRVAILSTATTDEESDSRSQSHPDTSETTTQSPPVEQGDKRTLAIESLGDQGDGITKVERGYVVIVPGARPGDEVEVEIQNARENVAFAEVIGTVSSTASEEE
ncbi:TRAM domain-containing protein [Halococcus sp. IIIV-5B]|uniref:TRAM domain-containing protein n=1 Tax=Halococcus sp. IIIV-5B TaxID=2321230 RepID=UPI000E735E40|nr:TRAM domain-containing protein [Halococcus sp. IIIV-5B]RJT07509.1 TRAM domain-containing protein [Halococcus sp. IIIV-5B]